MQDLNEKIYQRLKKSNFNVKGLLLVNGNVVTLGSDSKLIGRIFELISSEILQEICYENGWNLEETESQTVYPDFTISLNDGKKIAIDIKSTYRKYTKTGTAKFGFTLGSYASFLRNNTKNIAYPYDEYSYHTVIGFVYDRVNGAQGGLVKNINDNITIPYSNVDYFVQEKYKIAGDKPGSGNTENIGSILSTEIEDFKYGRGIFAPLGNGIFEDYWKNYPKYRETIKNYTNFEEYLEYKRKKIKK